MKPIRVAWDNTFAVRNVTGTGTYASRLLEQLATRDDLRMQVLCGPRAERGASTASRALENLSNLAWMHVRLPKLLRRGDFDLLHAPAGLAPRRVPCPLVVTLHDVSYLRYPATIARRWRAYMRTVVPGTLRRASAIVCGSEFSRQEIAKAYSLSLNKVHAIPYGVDVARFPPQAVLDKTWAARLGIRVPYVLHVGVLSARKNIPELLRAVARLRSQGKWNGRQLVLAGASATGILGTDEIHRTIEALDLTKEVVLAGQVPDEHLPGLYAGAELLVMTSLYEGFGFPVLESMAAGTPVVASNLSSLPEVAGDAARLVPPNAECLADAMHEVLADPALAAELRRRGFLRAQRFSWQLAAEQTAELYRKVIFG